MVNALMEYEYAVQQLKFGRTMDVVLPSMMKVPPDVPPPTGVTLKR